MKKKHLLLKSGKVITMDKHIGELNCADVLIKGKKIAAVEPAIDAEASLDSSLEKIAACTQ